MKAILALAVLAMAGSCFADRADDNAAYANRVGEERRTMFSTADKIKPETYRPDPSAYQSSKVDYTIVTLPSGKTATALTFK
jgi:hypothetical protein